uniref:(California timema) hypothetical protein n=1 Tax=Timema californicum TaxID=61474 RepID=A0A7R9JK77_TIMCA|nr:unnamed protein product [Timema californicum]
MNKKPLCYSHRRNLSVTLADVMNKKPLCYSHRRNLSVPLTDVMNKKPQAAWELYLKMETSSDSFSLLQLLANDCYKMGQFWFAAKAFDMLERLDPNPEHWEGKRGACTGVFQRIIAQQQPKELLTDVIQLLRNTANSQVEHIIRVMKRWAKDNRVNI